MCLPGKIVEISGFVEEKVDWDPPEFPLNPDLPRSFRNRVHFSFLPVSFVTPGPAFTGWPHRT
jgi:hypothetical protein